MLDEYDSVAARAVDIGRRRKRSSGRWRTPHQIMLGVGRPSGVVRVLCATTERDIWTPRYADITLLDVGMSQGCGRERIRQIEARALWKLRQPQRSRLLADAYPPRIDANTWVGSYIMRDGNGNRWIRRKPPGP